MLSDIRHALRTLRRNPILSTVALASLAIGIGANTAIFTLMDQLLLRSLPVRDPDRLLLVLSPGTQSGYIETSYNFEVSFSWSKYQALVAQTGNVFEGLLGRFPFDASIATKSATERGRGEMVTGNYFDLLGVHPALGRLMEPADTRVRGGNPVAVLSYGYWTSRLAGNPNVLNSTITVNGVPLTILGVVQPGFRSIGAGETPEVFVPITMSPLLRPSADLFGNPHGYWFNVFARLKPGVTVEQALAATRVLWRNVLEADAQQLPARASAEFRKKYVESPLILRPGGNGISSIRDEARVPLYLMMGMVGLVLLIACVNVANLLLARAAAREKEIAIRVSLGATRGRLLRRLMAESLLLSTGGGLLGLLVSTWAGEFLLRLIPAEIPLGGMTGDPDGHALLFALAISFATGLLFGCIPAWRASRPDPARALSEQSGSPATGGHARFRKVLVSGQIAMSLLLLAAAGLFARSLYRLKTIDPGFRSEHLITFSVNPALNGYHPEAVRSRMEEIRQAVTAIPGITGTTMAKRSLLTWESDMTVYRFEGVTNPKSVSLPQNAVGPAFFSQMGIPLVAGREIRDSDVTGAPLVALINQTLAKKYFGDRNPIGLHLILMGRGSPSYEIVGMVKDAKYDDLREEQKPFIYLAAAQDINPGPINFYIRSPLSAETIAPQLRLAVRKLDANLPVVGPRMVEGQILESLFLDRMVAALSVAFASVATILAAIGLYGVIAWAVSRRRREIGIRMAMGADPANVVKMILREVMWLALFGLLAAIPVWLLAAKLIESVLFQVKANDPLTLVAAVAIAASVAATAGFVPAWRAGRIDPISAIRVE